MKAFRRLLSERAAPAAGRRWLFVPYDQLSDRIGPLARERPEDVGIVLIENHWQLRRRPYHRQKIAAVILNMRNFALEQAARGVAIHYLVVESPYREVLAPLAAEVGGLRAMFPAERELRADIEPLVAEGSLQLVEHDGWLTTHDQFVRSHRKGPPWRMDAFYRHVRRATAILMAAGRPLGGRFSFDRENRETWRGSPRAPVPPTFPLDPVKGEVAELVEDTFASHPGVLDLESLPGTEADARKLWSWAKRRCLPHFGPYEDAMSTRSSGIFHTRLSLLINLCRLLPSDLIARTERMRIPLPSKEGFIRQVLGWREFVRHVHLASDGFRSLPRQRPPVARVAGDAGYGRWSGRPWRSASTPPFLEGGAAPCVVGGSTPLPPAYWGAKSGLSCLDRVVADVWAEGWSHHITRLVVLSGLAVLLDVSARELSDWFLVAYTDAYDWVVEPNVLGLGTFAVGDYLSTKPYVTGAAYINRMSDYCGDCVFDPRSDCPITNLYWAYLARHRDVLASNPRLSLPFASLARRSGERRRRDEAVFGCVRELLVSGQAMTPGLLAARAAPAAGRG